MNQGPSAQWEHIVDRAVRGTEVSDRLVSRGEQGWELVAATQDAEFYSLFFKRPIPRET
jgi:hypothetical protein